MVKYENYSRQLSILLQAPAEDLSNEFIMSGVINKFSLQFELAWKLLKEALAYEGESVALSGSPRDILKAAFATYDFVDEDIWLEMLKSRNDVSHIYNGDAARALVDRIINDYLPAFETLKEGLDQQYADTLFISR